MISKHCNDDSQYELYFTVSKFEGNMGYSLTQNYDEISVEIDIKGSHETGLNTAEQTTEEKEGTASGTLQTE